MASSARRDDRSTSSTSLAPKISLKKTLSRRHVLILRFALAQGVILMKKQEYRERECIHQDEGVEGSYYNGVFYVQALQRLPVDVAMQISKKVTSFFWSDAPHILVWLCNDCAAQIGLADTPRALTQTRRQA
jgi:hypothetical protein